jgi:hypothetical protein
MLKYMSERRDTIVFAAAVFAVLFMSFGGYKLIPRKEHPPVVAEPPHPDQLLQTAVQKVQADASMLMFSPVLSFKQDQPFVCTLAARTNADKEPDARARELVAAMKARYQGDCDFAVAARSALWPVFQRIADKGRLPSPPYYFEVTGFMGERGAKVGLFETATSCKALADRARELGLSATACAVWAQRF